MTASPDAPAACPTPSTPAGDDAAKALFAAYESLGIGRWSMDVDDSGRVTAVHQSRELRDLTGHASEALAERPLTAVFALVHPEDLPAIRAALKAAIDEPTGKAKYDITYRVKDETGAYHWFRAVGRGRQTADGRHRFSGLLFRHDAQKAVEARLEAQRRDLQARYDARHRRLEEIRALEEKEAEDLNAIRSASEALAAGRRRLENLQPVIEALSRDYSSVWLVRMPAMTVTLMRREGHALRLPLVGDIARQGGYREGIALYADHCVHPDDREAFKKAFDPEHVLAVLKQCRSYRYVYRHVTEDRTVWYCADLAPAQSGACDDFVAGFRSADRDVIAERQKKAELTAALEAAKAANQAKTRFLNAISHDIRTPLNAVTGMTALATAHLTDEASVRASLLKMKAAGSDLLSLINSVLDLARLASGKLVLNRDALHLPRLMQSVTDVLLAGAREKGLAFYTSIDGVTHEDAAGDAARLAAILSHLAENAVKFTPAGGRIDVRLEETGDDAAGIHYRFTCRDSGPGIPADFQEKLFTPFERADDVRRTNLPGSGLGLALAKRLLPLMSGDITVTSEEGRGSVFTADFVLEREPAAAPAPIAQGEAILVADDDPDEGRSICRQLSALGFAPDLALSGDACLAKAAEKPHALYLIDWRMPGTSGEAVVKALRASAAPEAPILLMSAYDMTAAKTALASERVAAFVKKPVFRSTLRAALLPILSGTAAADVADLADALPATLPACRILVADDNAINRELALELLADLGAEAEAAVDGADAVAHFEAHPAGWYDLILMDLRMPGTDGFAATRAIRRSLRSDAESVPVIALSAERTPEDEAAARASGMTGFITKPLTPEALAALLAGHLTGA